MCPYKTSCCVNICSICDMYPTELIFPFMQVLTGWWLVLIWLGGISSSSCNGTSGLLHIMGSNTVIKGVTYVTLILCYKLTSFLHWFLLFKFMKLRHCLWQTTCSNDGESTFVKFNNCKQSPNTITDKLALGLTWRRVQVRVRVRSS